MSGLCGFLVSQKADGCRMRACCIRALAFLRLAYSATLKQDVVSTAFYVFAYGFSDSLY